VGDFDAAAVDEQKGDGALTLAQLIVVSAVVAAADIVFTEVLS